MSFTKCHQKTVAIGLEHAFLSIATPSEAIAEGADYIVIGRPITDADDPIAAVSRVSEELSAL